jgi:hypothetical protein
MDIISIVLSGIAILLSVFSFVFQVIHNRRESTLNAFNDLQEQSLDKLYKYTPKQIEEIAQHFRSEEYKDISVLLARIEHFCVGVNLKIYDKNVVRRLGGSYIISTYNKMVPMIEVKRKMFPTDKHYDEYEKLATA